MTARRLLLLVCLCAALASASTAAAGPLSTAVVDPNAYYGPPTQLQTAFAHTRAAGATFVRIYVNWAQTVPSSRPVGFDASNPADPRYRWGLIDTQVILAERAGLTPILSVNEAPPWAERGRKGSPADYPVESPGSMSPDPGEIGAFAKAIATRYGGGFAGLPRVRYWQAWNEPNIFRFLNPQFSGPEATPSTPDSAPLPAGAKPLSPDVYRGMLNAFGHAVHAVHRDNKVIAGGLSPFERRFARTPAVAPLVFMRQLLCVTPKDKPKRGCPKLDFDIWAHHPYTDGDPEHRAQVRGNVSIPELPEMHRVLMVAARARHITAGRHVGFWVTEFSWNSNPPSPGGVPLNLQARWVAEGLYRMWQSGVSLVTWYLLRDDLTPGPPPPYPQYKSGLFNACSSGIGCDTPKLTFNAFRFPFVAYRGRRGVLVWGRTPWGARATVIVEQLRGRKWHRVASIRTGGSGIFSRTLRTRNGGPLRARIAHGGVASVPFSLRRPRDMTVNPFG